jgi:hypothetical protein
MAWNKTWVLDYYAGGVKIPPAVQERTRRRILAHAAKHYRGKYTRLDIRFHGQYCYIDAYQEPVVEPGWPPKDRGETREQYIERLRNLPTHLCRLQHFDENKWSLAFFTYSNKKYTPSVFHSGKFEGTPEEGFDVGATYLGGQG